MTEKEKMTFNQEDNLYHSIFRMAHIASDLHDGEAFETERVRIWDYFLLYPDKVHKIKIKRDEKDMSELRQKLRKYNNPYEASGNDRKHFAQIEPLQTAALRCLVACGILDREMFQMGLVQVSSREKLNDFLAQAGPLPAREKNVLSFLSLFSRNMPLTGIDGLKDRSRLMETKYDAD